MYYLKTLKFITHNRERIEIDDNGDVTGYYDIRNWQLGDNGEIAFVKVGEYIFTNSKFELMMKKNVTIFQNTESSKFSYFDILLCLYTQKICLYTQNYIPGTIEYQTSGVGYSKSIFSI